MADSDVIEVDVDLGGALKRLRGLRARSGNLAPVMGTVAETIQSGVEDNFRREVGPGAKPWADLAEETKEERVREGKWPGPILQRSGQLIAAIQPFSSPSEAGVSVQKTYAAIHQYGGTGDMPPGPAGIPPRPYLYLNSETQQEIEDDIAYYVEEGT